MRESDRENREALSGVQKGLENARKQVRLLERELEQTNRGVTALTLELERSRERFQALVEQAPTAFYLIRLDGRIVETNRLASDLTGFAPDELERMSIWELTTRVADEDAFREEVERLRTRGTVAVETSHRRRDGSLFPVEVRIGLLDVGGEQHVVALALDITERKELHKQLLQAQKMDAVGQLAGGIAHDFNNILSVILGEAEMARSFLAPSPELEETLSRIHGAGERAAALTRRLLTFSRQDVPEPTLVDLNRLVQELEKTMLVRVLGDSVELSTEADDGVWPVRMDPHQLEQVLLNLVINARDAMPDGGSLQIQIRNMTFTEAHAAALPDGVAGDHVEIVVRDSGTGMSEDVQRRLFEPFFTTKEKERGTGLGLATSYGIVNEARGHISVYSELGLGTAMKVYLPRAEGDVDGAEAERYEAWAPPGEPLIALIEDDPAVRDAALRMLDAVGYEVSAFEDGESALEALRGGLQPDLVILDVMLPGMDGAEVGRRIRDVAPTLPILYASGYGGDAQLFKNLVDLGADIVQKPFQMGELARKARRALDPERNG